MEHFFDAMERTLQTTGQTGHTKIRPPVPGRMRWTREFKAPVEAAVHRGTPKGHDYRQRGAPLFSPVPLSFFS